MTTLAPMYRGDEQLIDIVITVPSAPSYSGGDLWFTAKHNVADADAAAVIRIGTSGTGFSGVVVTACSSGAFTATGTIPAVATVLLADVDTQLQWDVQFKPPGGASGPVTLARGTILVRPDVTRAT